MISLIPAYLLHPHTLVSRLSLSILSLVRAISALIWYVPIAYYSCIRIISFGSLVLVLASYSPRFRLTGPRSFAQVASAVRMPL